MHIWAAQWNGSRHFVMQVGSGGVGETSYQLWHILANRVCAEQQSRCPTGAEVGRLNFEAFCLKSLPILQQAHALIEVYVRQLGQGV